MDQWSIGYLLRSTYLMERVVLTILALMLVYVSYISTVVARVFGQLRLARLMRGPMGPISNLVGSRRKVLEELRVRTGTLRSIGFTAPYLGLVGTCLGILDQFSTGYIGTRQGFVISEVLGIEAAFLSTAAGVLVAIPATGLFNYLTTRIDSLESQVASAAMGNKRFPLKARFSLFPFPVIAATGLALCITAFMVFPSLHPPKGLPVRLLRVGATEQPSLRPITIILAGSTRASPPDVFLDESKTPWDELGSRVKNELSMRSQEPPIYIQAEMNVYWKDVTNAIDVVEAVHGKTVLLTAAPYVKTTHESVR
jgi:biopolymer transport protein ExbD